MRPYDDFSIDWRSGPQSATERVWTGGVDDNWANAGNWGGTAPTTSAREWLVFNGTTRQNNINNISDLTVPAIVFNNGGFTISGNPVTTTLGIASLAGNNTLALPLNWDTIGSKTWTVASGSELVLNNTTTVEVNGDHYFYGSGTLRQTGNINIGQAADSPASSAFSVMEGVHIIDGGSFISRGSYRVGSLATATAGAQTILQNGALLYVTATAGSTRVGDSACPFTSRLEIDHSTYKTDGTPLCIPYAVGAIGEVAQLGGQVLCPISFCYLGDNTGTYTIKDGTLEPLYVKKTGAGGNAEIHFDNALLRAPGEAESAFMSGLDYAEIQAGGLAIDAQADVVVDQKLEGPGALTKSGPSSVTLGGANTYSGATTVEEGVLLISGSIASGGVTVQHTATLGGSGTIGGNVTVEEGGTLSPGTSIGILTVNGDLTIESGSTTSVEVNRSGPSSDLITGLGALTMGGTLEVVNTGAALEAADVFTLFSATSKSGEFAAISPANPNSDEDLAWDTPYLKDNGILRVHHRPNANDLNRSRSSGTSLKIKLSDLFSTTDDDGDTVVLEQCKPSTQGATITANSTYIFYNPVSNENDDFDYVVTDNRGGKRTRKITISVEDTHGDAQHITVLDGKATVQFAGIPGFRYDVERATDVNFTENVTTVLSTNAPVDGLFLLVDEPGLSQAYYRLKYPGTPAAP